MTRQQQIEVAEKRLNDEASAKGLPGTFLVSMRSDGRWAVQYCGDRTRGVTNKQKSIDDAVERALLWMMD